MGRDVYFQAGPRPTEKKAFDPRASPLRKPAQRNNRARRAGGLKTILARECVDVEGAAA